MAGSARKSLQREQGEGGGKVSLRSCRQPRRVGKWRGPHNEARGHLLGVPFSPHRIAVIGARLIALGASVFSLWAT